MSKSNYLETAVLYFWLKGNSGSTYSAPANVYLGILSTATDDDTLTEIAGSSYSATDGDGAVTSGNRPKIVFGSVSDNQIQGPTSDIEYDNTSGSQFTVNGFGIYDAATGGNLLYWGTLSSSKQIENGDSIRFEASTSITITEA